MGDCDKDCMKCSLEGCPYTLEMSDDLDKEILYERLNEKQKYMYRYHRSDAYKAYTKSEDFKANQRRYRQTDKGKAVQKRYYESEKGKIAIIKKRERAKARETEEDRERNRKRNREYYVLHKDEICRKQREKRMFKEGKAI